MKLSCVSWVLVVLAAVASVLSTAIGIGLITPLHIVVLHATEAALLGVFGALVTFAGVAVAGAGISVTLDSQREAHEADARAESGRREAAEVHEQRQRIEDAMVSHHGPAWREAMHNQLVVKGAKPAAAMLERARVSRSQLKLINSKLFEEFDRREQSEARTEQDQKNLEYWSQSDPVAYNEYERRRANEMEGWQKEAEEGMDEQAEKNLKEEAEFRQEMRDRYLGKGWKPPKKKND